jgi:hypothetical protein
VLSASDPTCTQGSKRSLAPAPGVTAPPTDGSSYRFLSDVIIARGLVEPSAMKAALQASLAGRSLTELLVDNGSLGEDDLARTLAEHHRLDHVDLEVFAVDHEAASLIEPDVARRFGAVPIATLPMGAIVVALHDPNGSTAALEFARLTRRMIQPAVASRTQIETLIESLRRERMSAEDMVGAAPAIYVAAAAPSAAQAELPGAAASPPPAPGRGTAGDGDARVDALRRRAEAAERRCHEAEERARAADELSRLAEARSRAPEQRSRAAGEAVVADVRAGEKSSAAGAANDVLGRLVHACEMLEHEAQARGSEADVLRTLLEAERAQRMQLEAQLRRPDDVLHVLKARVAELERLVAAPARDAAAEPVAAGPAHEPQLAEPAPAELAAEPAPEEPAPQPAPELAAEPAPEELAEPQPDLVDGEDGRQREVEHAGEVGLGGPFRSAPAVPAADDDRQRATQAALKARRRHGLFGSRARGS